MIAYLLDRYRAWRRGEVRTAPKGVRGRVYRRKDDPAPETPDDRLEDGAHMVAASGVSAVLHIQVIRADGSVEDHGSVPMEVSQWRP